MTGAPEGGPTTRDWSPPAEPTVSAIVSAPVQRRHRRGGPDRMVIAVAAALLVVAAVIIVLATGNGDGRARRASEAAPAKPVDASRELRALKGIDQVGSVLGDPDSRGRLTVFADIASRQYADFDQRVLPRVISRFVKPGDLSVQVRTLPGPATAGGPGPALYAQAAGLQTRLWQFVRALAASAQTDPRATRVQRAIATVPGLDRARLERDVRSGRVKQATAAAAARARAAKAKRSPVLTLSVGDRVLRRPVEGARSAIVRFVSDGLRPAARARAARPKATAAP